MRGARFASPQRIWLAAILGTALSLAACFIAGQAEHRRDEAEFQRHIANYVAAFHEWRNSVEDLLRTLRALFNQNPGLERSDFHEVIQDLAIRPEGVQALAWAPRVTSTERSVVEAAVRNEGFADFQITEGDLTHAPDSLPERAGARAEYLPVLLLEPYAGNEHVLGYDLTSVPEVRDIAERARAFGRISLCSQVRVPHNGRGARGFVLVIPVYHPMLMPGNTELRLEHFRGCVIAVGLLENLLDQLERRLTARGLEVMFLDTEAPAESRLLALRTVTANRPGSQADVVSDFRSQPHHERTVTLGGQSWTLVFRRGTRWSHGWQHWYPGTLLIGGLMVTTLLVQYLRATARRTREVEREVEERTAQLAAANAQLQGEVRERIEAQTALARDRGLLRTLLDRLPDAVFVTDASRRYVLLNEAHRALLGLENAAAAVGRAVAEVGPPALAKLLDAGTSHTLQSGVPELHEEVTLPEPTGQDRSLQVSRIPLRNPTGAIEGLVVLARETTDERRAAAAKDELDRRLQATQKLESLGLLAGGIAHDFNNLLTTVMGNVSLAQLEVTADSAAAEYLDQIQHSATRAADLCRQLLAYSGKGRFVVRRLDLSRLVEETTDLLRVSVSKKAALSLHLARGLPAVMGDATQLRQIVMNLVLNASDAVSDRVGQITLATGLMHADAAFLAQTVGAGGSEGDYVYLEVADNGCGMTPATLARIFDPFFTTKFTGRGLGLAAVLGIVRGHKGMIKVDSAPDRGTTFRLLLPCAQGAAEPEANRPANEPAFRGSGVLLVVDDEQTVRTVTARLLEAAGFTVELAADGQEAVRKFAAAPDLYRGVLLDLTMPLMDGQEAFREIQRIRARTRVLLMSGFSEQEAVNRIPEPGLGGFIQKPFGPDTLYAAVRALLSAGQG